MTNVKKKDVKAALKKFGKAVWSVFPWICSFVALTCWFSILFIQADRCAQRAKQLVTLEAENAMYETENARLNEEIEWLRSFIERIGVEEDGDGQIQQ